MSVWQGIKFAKEYALANGPMMIEFDTYRYHGHSMSDPGSTYRTRDEISTMRQQRDPVEHVRKLILDNGFADASDLKKLEKVRPFAQFMEGSATQGSAHRVLFIVV